MTEEQHKKGMIRIMVEKEYPFLSNMPNTEESIKFMLDIIIESMKKGVKNNDRRTEQA